MGIYIIDESKLLPAAGSEMRETISSRILTVLDDAITQVSDGDMKFSVRNLFYAVMELYKKRFLGVKFYKNYDSFSQDFLRSYEKLHGKISGLTRERRGNYLFPNEDGSRKEGQVGPNVLLQSGCGNKIIIVEKAGLYENMKENKFDVRLDAVLMYTSGFTTEAGRDLLIQAEDRGLTVCVLHDYDVAGLLIYETLTKPTKRLNTWLSSRSTVDVGLNWEVIEKIREERDMTPEPTNINKSQLTALGNMLDEGVISGIEYDFLRDGRIELNQLTPRELLEWLEKRLDELGLWKTVPSQDELNTTFKGHLDDNLEDGVHDRGTDLRLSLMEGFGLTELYDGLVGLAATLSDRSRDDVRDLIGELDFPTMSAVDLEESLRENPMRYWTKAMEEDGDPMLGELENELDGAVAEPSDELKDRIKEDESVRDYLVDIKNAVEAYLAPE